MCRSRSPPPPARCPAGTPQRGLQGRGDAGRHPSPTLVSPGAFKHCPLWNPTGGAEPVPPPKTHPAGRCFGGRVCPRWGEIWGLCCWQRQLARAGSQNGTPSATSAGSQRGAVRTAAVGRAPAAAPSPLRPQPSPMGVPGEQAGRRAPGSAAPVISPPRHAGLRPWARLGGPGRPRSCGGRAAHGGDPLHPDRAGREMEDAGWGGWCAHTPRGATPACARPRSHARAHAPLARRLHVCTLTARTRGAAAPRCRWGAQPAPRRDPPAPATCWHRSLGTPGHGGCPPAAKLQPHTHARVLAARSACTRVCKGPRTRVGRRAASGSAVGPEGAVWGWDGRGRGRPGGGVRHSLRLLLFYLVQSQFLECF